MKSLQELMNFLEVNTATWKAEIESYPEAKAKREGAIELVGLIKAYVEEAEKEQEEKDSPSAP